MLNVHKQIAHGIYDYLISYFRFALRQTFYFVNQQVVVGYVSAAAQGTAPHTGTQPEGRCKAN